MNPSKPERPWLAMAAQWTSKITSVAGQMVLPPLLGLWLDRMVGSVCLFLILGGIFGFAAGIAQLLQWLRSEIEIQLEEHSRQEAEKPLLAGPELAQNMPQPDFQTKAAEQVNRSESAGGCSSAREEKTHDRPESGGPSYKR
ncbi:MAG: AtpZ/AtpI family protein [Thermoguttaceae bacterium]|nr:AtpZ/AtpI family protein [Thermoguttaceae bacterium]MDW8039398.1 AtpZ/AtpI family protein [Thermoguttaceae bacterium]